MWGRTDVCDGDGARSVDAERLQQTTGKPEGRSPCRRTRCNTSSQFLFWPSVLRSRPLGAGRGKRRRRLIVEVPVSPFHCAMGITHSTARSILLPILTPSALL